MEKFDISLPKARYFIRDREQKDDTLSLPLGFYFVWLAG